MRRPAILMTDPRHFAIRGGANPHTRNPDQTLKSVDARRAWNQWHAYVDALLERGVDVYVARAEPSLTGMVFAANAGLIPERLEDRPVSDKEFYPSHFTAEHRRGEREVYSEFLENFGFDVVEYDESMRFEGEADAFPVGRGEERTWIFTHGFRSDPEVGDWLESEVVGSPIRRYELSAPKYYHGDCVLCDLGGPLLGWPGGLTENSARALREDFGGRLVELNRADGSRFIGNSFYVETESERLLYVPAEISGSARSAVEAEGIEVVPVDVSEFFGKGGGGPKCLVFNLGPVDPDEPSAARSVRAFRERRHVENLRRQDYFPG